MSYCVQVGETALCVSSFFGHGDVVKQLIEHGANVETAKKVCVVSTALTYSGTSLNGHLPIADISPVRMHMCDSDCTFQYS